MKSLVVKRDVTVVISKCAIESIPTQTLICKLALASSESISEQGRQYVLHQLQSLVVGGNDFSNLEDILPPSVSGAKRH
jgi:hypothetical protein